MTHPPPDSWIEYQCYVGNTLTERAGKHNLLVKELQNQSQVFPIPIPSNKGSWVLLLVDRYVICSYHALAHISKWNIKIWITFPSNEHRKPLKIHLLKSKSFFKKNYMKLTDDNSIFHKNPSLHVSLPKYHISFSPSSLNFSIFSFQ